MPPPPYTLADLRARRAEIEAAAARHHAANIRVIGSTARGEDNPLRDVDLLVDMDPDRVLAAFAYFAQLERLQEELTVLLGCRVDVVDARGIETNAPLLRSAARLRENMLRDAVAL